MNEENLQKCSNGHVFQGLLPPGWLWRDQELCPRTLRPVAPLTSSCVQHDCFWRGSFVVVWGQPVRSAGHWCCPQNHGSLPRLSEVAASSTGEMEASSQILTQAAQPATADASGALTLAPSQAEDRRLCSAGWECLENSWHPRHRGRGRAGAGSPGRGNLREPREDRVRQRAACVSPRPEVRRSSRDLPHATARHSEIQRATATAFRALRFGETW